MRFTWKDTTSSSSSRRCGHANDHASIRGVLKCFVAWRQRGQRRGEIPEGRRLRGPGGTIEFCHSDGSPLTPSERQELEQLQDQYARSGTF